MHGQPIIRQCLLRELTNECLSSLDWLLSLFCLLSVVSIYFLFLDCRQVKGKGHPRTGHEVWEGERGCDINSTLCLNSVPPPGRFISRNDPVPIVQGLQWVQIVQEATNVPCHFIYRPRIYHDAVRG